MIEFISEAFDIALNVEPFTSAVCVFFVVACVWRLTWYLMGGLNG